MFNWSWDKMEKDMKGLERWRRELWKAGLEPGDIEELEDHLINHIEEHLDQGHTAEEALELAKGDLSLDPEQLARAFVESRTRRKSLFHWRSVPMPPLSLHYKVAVRTFRKNSLYALINILGLSVSVAAAFLVWLVVDHETSYDATYPDVDRIYRVVNQVQINGEFGTSADVGQPVGPNLKAEFPEVTNATRVRRIGLETHLQVGETRLVSEDVFVADEEFFQVFDRRFLRGNPNVALTEPNTIVISEQLALELFGHIDVVDSFLFYSSVVAPMQVKVTGVLAAMNGPTHLPFEALVSYPTYFGPKELSNWLRKSYTYVKLNDAHAISRLSSQLPLFNEKYLVPAYKGVGGTAEISLQPVRNVHLDPPHRWEPYPHGSPSDIRALQVLITILLLMAAINYVNLSTATTSERLHNIRIRKTLGASQSSLVIQFLVESAMLAGAAGIAGLALAALFTPHVEFLSGIKLDWTDSWRRIATLIFGAVALGVLSGIYPAWQMAKNRKEALVRKSSSAATLGRRFLVGSQYFISSVLLIGIAVVYSQIHFLKQRDIGFEKERIVQFSAPKEGGLLKRFPAFIDELSAIPSVRGVSISEQQLDAFRGSGSQSMVGPDGAPIRTTMGILFVGEDFFRTIGASITAGRGFDRHRNNDWTFLLNEEAARVYGWEGEALKVKWRDDGSRGVAGIWRCIGVVEDFVLGEAHRAGVPMMICYDNKPRTNSNFLVGLNDAVSNETYGEMRTTWKKYFPGEDFVPQLLSDRLDALYLKEEVFMKFLVLLGLIAVIITVLGVFGLVYFAISARKKEIALRKIHGAPLKNLIWLLSIDFVLLLLAAGSCAVPVGFYLGQRWLEDFEIHIQPQTWQLLAPIPICLLFTGFAISYHILRAAKTNPIEALRYE